MSGCKAPNGLEGAVEAHDGVAAWPSDRDLNYALHGLQFRA